MFESMVTGLSFLFQPTIILYQLFAILIGIIIGIIPGLTGIVLLAIFIPFTWTMDPQHALAFLMAGYAVCNNGGTITAILINIPGTGANSATLLDGFPMSQQGKAGQAIGAALTASALGGLFGGIVLAIFIPIVRPVVLAFGAPESFFLVIMGLSFISAVGRGSMGKALFAALLGLLFSFVGYHASTAFPRYSFGMTTLFDGINIVPCALAVFAIPEMIDLMYKGGSISKVKSRAAPLRDVIEGCKAVIRHWWLLLRCSALGTIVGIVPGVGADVSVWVAYGHAKITSKNPEAFGKGAIEGVIAPESASNGKEGGALLPTLALGIPGSAAMAILLGAFLVLGIQPGPRFLVDHLDLAWTIVGALIISNIIGSLLCVFIGMQLIRITQVRAQFLAPVILCITALGAYCGENSAFDVFLMFALSLLGWSMRKLGYSRPSFFLGFILGALAERYYNISVQTYGWQFFLTPISLVIIGLTFLGVFYEQLKAAFGRLKA
ncbi:MAG: tripartite tricarboxylate transporter permease [Thermodesulfobacteriota bacterium]